MSALFAVTVVLAAGLLFVVQPMAGKMVLPVLGGAPAVWNTCVVFFQAALLAGYAYAHATSVWLGRWAQLGFHVALLLVAAGMLPLRIDRGPVGLFAATDAPTLWLLARLPAALGLPFVALAATAPLLQRWFSRASHPAGRDPYFLYAASNLGSLVALLGYPLLVEPRWSLGQQSDAWAIAYVAFTVLVALCGVWAARRVRPEPPPGDPDVTPPGLPDPIGARRRLRWLALGFVPSSYLLGVTAFLGNDIAAVPLLWVVPLGLYLLSFVLVYTPRPLLPHRSAARALPALVPGINKPGTAVQYNAYWIEVHNAPGFRPNPLQPAETCGEWRARVAKGRRFLDTRQTFQLLASAKAYYDLWKAWGLSSRPADFDQQVMQRYGLAPAPFITSTRSLIPTNADLRPQPRRAGWRPRGYECL